MSITGTPSKADQELWSKMVALEPELDEILQSVRKVAAEDRMNQPQDFCAHAYWFGFKRRMKTLVGWVTSSDADPLLRSSAAYDAAYNVLYGELPDCRHDPGLCRSEPPERR